MTTREKIAELTRELYSSRTSRERRSELSMEVAILRCRLTGTRDPLESMCRASASDEEVES